MTASAITVNGLRKSFGETCVLDGADGGQISVAGYDITAGAVAARAAIGVTGQIAAVDSMLTGAENLQLMADRKRLRGDAGRRCVGDLLERVSMRTPELDDVFLTVTGRPSKARRSSSRWT